MDASADENSLLARPEQRFRVDAFAVPAGTRFLGS